MSKVLVDTSVWVEHFRRHNLELTTLLGRDSVLTHPLVIGELACGTPPDRSNVLADLAAFEQTQQASLNEVMAFIEREQLFGKGCGLIDMLLLGSSLMTPNTALWTFDKRLSDLADHFGILYRPLLRVAH